MSTLEHVEPEVAGGARSAPPIVDADVHTAMPEAALAQRLSPRWRERLAALGQPTPRVSAFYPRARNLGFRLDAWPAGGGPPGSDLELLREQLLDRWNVRHAILNPFDGIGFGVQPPALAAALVAALNDWTCEAWLDRDDRLRAAIAVPVEDADLAVREIERVCDDARFVQVLMPTRTQEPLGARRYWPLYEAAAHHRLPIAVHVGGVGPGPVTGAGWPSYYLEEHLAYAGAVAGHVASLVGRGVFERFPELRLVIQEAGLSWVPPLMWALDEAWRTLGSELAELPQAPSAYVRRHLWLTTQPIEEPDDPQDLARMLDLLGMDDRVLFATDYPHWDFDAPDRALPRALGHERIDRIRTANAYALYGPDALGRTA